MIELAKKDYGDAILELRMHLENLIKNIEAALENIYSAKVVYVERGTKLLPIINQDLAFQAQSTLEDISNKLENMASHLYEKMTTL